jgi:hypothetical protein
MLARARISNPGSSATDQLSLYRARMDRGSRNPAFAVVRLSLPAVMQSTFTVTLRMAFVAPARGRGDKYVAADPLIGGEH